METVTDFIFEGSKITADGDCSHEIKRHLLLGRKIMTNLDSILKSRDITLPTKVHLVKTLVFPVVVYGCESWTIKKAECWRIDAFELWCWRRHLRVPWTARRSNQSILKEISPEYSLEGLMLKQNSNTWATWCEELTHLKRPWCWEWLRAGGEGDDRRWDGWIASLTKWTWVWVSSRSWWWTGKPGVLQSMGSERVEHDWTTKLNWTLNIFYVYQFSSVQSLSCVWLFVTPCTNHSMPGLPVHHQLLEFTQTHVHRVGDAIQPSHPLSSPSPPAPLPPRIRVFSSESTLRMRWPKYWSFNLSISPSD